VMSNRVTRNILEEIQELIRHAGISRRVITYKSAGNQFLSFGGSLSLMAPVLFVPDQHLYRKNGIALFSEENREAPLRSDWIFTDNETRFLICRELGKIKTNTALIRIAIKITIIAFLFIIYKSSLGLPLSATLFLGAIGLYILSEKFFQGRADQMGVEILSKKVTNAKDVAISALKKMLRQNLARRSTHRLAKFYITKSGNNILDFIHPFVTTRIDTLSQM